MTTTRLEFSRGAVLTSLVAALASFGWLLADSRPVVWTAAAAFAAAALVARVSLTAALAPPLVLAYATPALFTAIFGIAEYQHLIVWLAALSGAALSAADWRRWHLPADWRWPLVAWALIVAATWPIIAGRELDFSLVAARTATSNGLGVGSPAQAAAWVLSVAIGQLVAIIWIDLLWTRFGAANLRGLERGVLLPLLIGALVAAAAGIYQDWIDITWLNEPHWANADRAGGLLRDANSFGTSAALWLGAGVALAWRLGGSTVLAVALFGLLAAGMWASGSRTALIAAVIIAVGFAAALTRRGWKAQLVYIIALVAVAVVIVVMAVANRGMERGSPLKRALESLPHANSPQSVLSELRTRHGYGLAAERAIADHPLTGVGVGAFNLLAPGYYYLLSGQTIATDNAQNWWRHQVAEFGWVGAVPPLLFSLVLLVMLRKPAPPPYQPIALVLKATVVAVGVISVLGLSTQHPALLLTFVTFIVWLAMLLGVQPSAPPALTGARPLARAAGVLLVALPLAVALGQAWSATRDLRVPHRARQVGFVYAYGFSAPEPAPGTQLRWTERRAVAVLPVLDRYLAITMWTMHPDISERPVHVTVWKDGQRAADFESRAQQPVTQTLAMADGQKWVEIELEISRTFGADRGLRVAPRWLPKEP